MATIHFSASVTGKRAVSWVLVAYVGLGVSQAEVFAGAPTCPGSGAAYAQCPNFADNGAETRAYYLSDVGGDDEWSVLSLADDFSLQEQTTIYRIRWWGTILLSGSEAGCGYIFTEIDDFTVLLWRNADGNPGGPDPVPIPSYRVSCMVHPVGEVMAGLGPVLVLEYDLAFEEEGFQAEPGETYWIEVHNDRTAYSPCLWFWMTAPSPPGDGTSRQRIPTTDPDWSTPTVRRFDLAFAMLSEPGEPIVCVRVPGASQWGLIALTLVLLTAGTIVLRYHHPQCAVAQRTRPGYPPFRGEGS